jgi:hypothetical protein
MNLRGPPPSKDPQPPTRRSLQELTRIISQQNDKVLPEELSYGDIRKELSEIIEEILDLKRSKLRNGKNRRRAKNE